MSLYVTGTITGALNATTISGTGTKWSDAKLGITNGSVLFISSNAGVDGVYQVKRVISDTSIELAQPIYKTFTNSKYSILVAESASTAAWSNQLAATLGYYQAQMDGWQQIMTGTGDVALTAPDGTKVTIKSFTALDKDKMSIGAFGIGAENPPKIDNSVANKTGLYCGLANDIEIGNAWSIRGQAVGIINVGMHPTSSSKFSSQIATSYSTKGRVFFRCSLDGIWNAWKEVYCSGASNAKFGSGLTVENEPSGGYIVFNVVNNARPITDNGCKFAIEIPNSTERPYMLQRKNDGTTTGQIVNQLPVSSGQIAIQGTSGREFKKDVVDADGTEALNRINELRLVNYIYIDDEKGRLRFGFIAEEAEIIAPQYIKHMQEPIDEIVDPDSGEVIDRIYRDRPCVDNNPIVMDLLGAIQALTSKVNEQEARLLALEKTTSNR